MILVPLVLGLIHLALVLHVRNTLTAAATEGARYGATLDRAPADGVARARRQLSGVIAGRYAEGMSGARETVGGVPTVVVRVRAVVPPLGLWGPGLKLSVSGHGVEEDALESAR